MVSKLNFERIEKTTYIDRYDISLDDFMHFLLPHLNESRSKANRLTNLYDIIPFVDFKTITSESGEGMYTDQQAFNDAEQKFNDEAKDFKHTISVDASRNRVEDGECTSYVLRGLVANINSDKKSYLESFEQKPSYENNHELSVAEYLTFEANRLGVSFPTLRKATEFERIAVFLNEPNGSEYSAPLVKRVLELFDERLEDGQFNAILKVRNKLKTSDNCMYEYKISFTGVKYDLNKL